MPAPKVDCPNCQELFAKTYLPKHLKKCKGSRPRVPCLHDGCGKDFVDEEKLRVHFENVHSGMLFPCPSCQELVTKSQFEYHKRMHNGGYKCPHPGCYESRANKKNLLNHINLQHNGDYPTIEEAPAQVVQQDSNKREADEMSHRIATEKTKKTKTTEIDAVDAFLDSMGDRLKYSNPMNPRCRSKEMCIITDLGYGFSGEEKSYCKKHRDEVPGLILVGAQCKYVGCKKKAHYKIGKLRFCGPHRDQLISEGLPDGKENVAYEKDYSRKCIEEGCGTSATFDNFTHCGPHSSTGKSDDKRVCEIPGCETRPSVGFPGEQQRWCGKHRDEGMVSHGLCVETGCDKRASYGVSGGKKTSCVGHKKDGYVILGTTICAMACCGATSGGLQAVFFHPDHEDETSEFFNKRICRFGRRVLIEDALMHNDVARVESLVTHFQMDRVLTLNAQSAFRFACESRYHELLKDCVDIVFDAPVEKGPKVIGALRPDIFYKWSINGVNYGIHIEYDETSSHEDDARRLQSIAENAECGDRVYVIRVYGGHDTKNPACTRVHMDNFEYFKVTGEGENVAVKVADAVTERIQWIKEGLGPDASRPSCKGI